MVQFLTKDEFRDAVVGMANSVWSLKLMRHLRASECISAEMEVRLHRDFESKIFDVAEMAVVCNSEKGVEFLDASEFRDCVANVTDALWHLDLSPKLKALGVGANEVFEWHLEFARKIYEVADFCDDTF